MFAFAAINLLFWAWSSGGLQFEFANRREISAIRSENRKLLLEILRIDQSTEASELIIELRDYVYRKTILGPGDFDYQNPFDHFIKFNQNQVEMYCGGMAMTYSWLLGKLGVPSRTVQLLSKRFYQGDTSGETLVSVEVFDNKLNKWIISDPTFNVSFTCDGQGELLSLQDLYDCKSRGREIAAVENGITYLPGRRLSEYHVKYADLLFSIKAGAVGSLIESFEIPRSTRLNP